MIPRMRLNRLFVMLGLVGFVLGAMTFAPKNQMSRVFGSDHREAPTVDQMAEGELTDLYAFIDPNTPANVDFVINTNPFANSSEAASYSFSPSFLYQIKID